MKKSFFLLVAATFLMTSAAFAQIEKGAVLVGASSSLGFTKYDEKLGDYSKFDINLKGGYFIIDNLSLGLNIGYSKNSEVDDALITIGPFARYYVNGKIIVGAGFNSMKQGDASATTIPIEVGYAAFINNFIAVEPTLNYTSYSGDLEGSAFGLNVGFSLYLGRGE